MRILDSGRRAACWTALALLAGCGDGSGDGRIAASRSPGPLPDPAAHLQAWNRGILEMDQHRFVDALKTFDGLTRALPDAAAAWINHALAAMNGVTPELFRVAEDSFARALRLAPGHLHAHHGLGVLLKHLGRNEEAEPHFRAVLAKDPHDPAANYYLATLLAAKDDLPGAEKHLRAALAAEPHLSSALNRLFLMFARSGRPKEGEPFREAFVELEKAGTGDKAGIVYQEMGRYGEAIREFPGRVPAGAVPPAKIAYGRAAVLLTPRHDPLRPPPRPSPPADQAETWWRGVFEPFGPGAALADVDRDGDQDLYLADMAGAGHLFLNAKGAFTEATEAWGLAGEARSVSGCFGDIDNDGDPDLFVACAGPDRLYRNDGGKFADITAAAGVAGGNLFTAQAVMADLDSDGDVDIFCARLADLDAIAKDPATPRDAFPGAADALFNNNRDGTFTDIAARAGTAGGTSRSAGVLASDLDGDHDADLLVLGFREPARLYRNDRIWRFADVTAGTGVPAEELVAGGAQSRDLDGDGAPDLVLSLRAAVGTRVLRNLGRLRFEPDPALAEALRSDRSTTAVAADADNDGDQDLVLAGEGEDAGGKVLARGPGEAWTALEMPGSLPVGAGLRTLLAADLDGDGVLDLVQSRTGPAAEIWRGSTGGARTQWVEVALHGVREEGKMRANTGGLGALVSATAGTLTQTLEIASAGGALGGPAPVAHFGLGPRAQADYVRIVWPDDVIQSEPNLPSGQRKTITQVYRKGSSCPLLFAWDGTRFAFVTDFLGTGGLGFFVEPGVYAPPDPTELVAIPKLAPKDGAYEIRIHEPMEEVLYLDEARLLVVDHPDGIEVWPDERLATGPPDQTGRLLAIRPAERRFPVAVETLDGPADPDLVRDADRRHLPGVRPDRRFLGYAAPQAITLDFADALARRDPARPLFLFLDGWVEYPYSHVNFAAWQAGLRMEALSLDAETAPGAWTTVLPELGYPAGLPRVMAVDVSALPRGGTGRIRLRTNLELSIDRIWLAEDLGPGALRVRDLAARGATLRPSGYPREYSPDGREPLLYDYGLMDPAVDFKTMAGAYTRFGDVAPLLAGADDRCVIMGKAEEVVLSFDAPPGPPPGHARSFVLRSAGWCKDMDLYTAWPETVEPLPFHGMSAYPYPPSERFPAGPVHDADRLAFHTRRVERAGR